MNGTAQQAAQALEGGFTYWIKPSWTRLWWYAIDPDEPLACFDTSTVQARAWTREGLIAKLRERRNAPRRDEWEEIRV